MPVKKKMSTFSKALLILLALLVFVLLGFFYAFNQSNVLLKAQLISNYSVLLNTIETQANSFVNQAELFASLFLQDPDIKDLEFFAINPDLYTGEQLLDLKIRIYKRLNSFISLTGPYVYYAVYAPAVDMVFCINTKQSFDPSHFHENSPSFMWTARNVSACDTYFIKHFSQHAYLNDSSHQTNMIEVGISAQWLKDLISHYASVDTNIAFVDSAGVVWGSLGAPDTSSADLYGYLQSEQKDSFHFEHSNYLFNIKHCDALNGYFVHTHSISNVFASLRTIRFAFILCALLTSLISIVNMIIIYRNLHKPLNEIKHVLDLVTDGNYHIRIEKTFDGEFQNVVIAFNRMATQIDTLINHVYQAQLRAQEALFRQYQAQINPHFLYNCLFYIKNMAAMEEYDAVINMALNLGTYYRYMTRIDESTTSLEQELEMIQNYIRIMQMRTQKVEYQLCVEPDVLPLPIPKLLLQPIVENAILHGISASEASVTILISGRRNHDSCRLTIQNNGSTPDKETIEKLYRLASSVEPESTSYGIWNLSQRLKMFYGEDAKISFEPLESGGLIVTLSLQWPSGKEQEHACPIG